MANYTQPSRTLPSTSSAYIDEAGRQIAMSIYNPLYKGSKRDYISYSSMGVTASLAISASERTPTSSIVFYSGSNQVFLLSASAAFTAGINLEVGYTLSDPSVTFRSTTYTSSDAIGDVFKGILALIPLSQIVPLSVGLGFGILKSRLGIGAGAALGSSMVTGGASATAAAAATRGSKTATKSLMGGALGVAGVALIVANSIFQVYQGISNALENSLNEDGTRDYSRVAAYFFAGQGEGSGLNAIIQANSVGGMFAGPAAIAGLAVAGLPGALIGGALGYGIGAIVGGIAGYMGAENLNDVINIVGSKLKDGLIGIANFFSNFVEGVQNLATGGSFTDAFNQSELEKKKKALATFEKRTGVNPFKTTEADAIAALGEVPEATSDPGGGRDLVAYKQRVKDIKKLFQLKKDLTGYIDSETTGLPAEIEAAQAALDAHLASGPEKADPTNVEQVALFGDGTGGFDMERAQLTLNAKYEGTTKMLQDNLQATIDKQNEIDLAKQNILKPGNLQETSRTQLDRINRSNSISSKQILDDLTNMLILNEKINKNPAPFVNFDNNNDKSVNVQNETIVNPNLSVDRVNNSGKILSSKGVYQDLFF